MEQYQQHDWSSVVWAVLLLLAALAVFATMALFLVMASRPAKPRARRRGGRARHADKGGRRPPHAPAA